MPPDLDLDAIAGLSSEIRARLAEVAPGTLAAAGRLPGMTPAALAALYRYAGARGVSRGAAPARAAPASRRRSLFHVKHWSG